MDPKSLPQDFTEEEVQSRLGRSAMRKELRRSVLGGLSGLQVGQEVEKGMVSPNGAGSKEVSKTQSQGQYISGRREEAAADLHPVLTGESQPQNREEGGRGGRVLSAKTSDYSTVRKKSSCGRCGRKAAKVIVIPIPGPNASLS